MLFGFLAVLVAACIWILWHGRSVASGPDLDAVLVLMRETFLAHPEVVSAEISTGDKALDIALASGQSSRAYPHELAAQLWAAPDDASSAQVFEEYLTRMSETFRIPEPVAEEILDPDQIKALRAVLRHRDLAHAEHVPDGVFHRPFAGDLCLFAVLDRPEAPVYLTEVQFQSLGMSQKSFAERHTRFLPKPPETSQIAEGIYRLSYDGVFEASYLLEHLLWTQWARQGQGVLMVAPARGCIFFSVGQSPGQRAELGLLRQQFLRDAPYPLSDLMYRWTADGWEVEPE
jgi:hypothetical protein